MIDSCPRHLLEMGTEATKATFIDISLMDFPAFRTKSVYLEGRFHSAAYVDFNIIPRLDVKLWYSSRKDWNHLHHRSFVKH